MTQNMITFSTLSQAQRAARVLERAGYTVTIRRIPADLSRSGCGYAITLRRAAYEAVALLKTDGLWTGKLFRREGEEPFREVLP